jgi:hypothetical protein
VQLREARALLQRIENDLNSTFVTGRSPRSEQDKLNAVKKSILDSMWLFVPSQMPVDRDEFDPVQAAAMTGLRQLYTGLSAKAEGTEGFAEGGHAVVAAAVEASVLATGGDHDGYPTDGLAEAVSDEIGKFADKFRNKVLTL